MRREGRSILVLAWAGAAFVGGVSFFLFNNPPPLPGLWAGVVYALVLLVLAGFAYRVGRTDIGIGLLIGYAVLSLASGGTCTLLELPLLEGDPVTGLNFYSLFLVRRPFRLGSTSPAGFAHERSQGRKETKSDGGMPNRQQIDGGHNMTEETKFRWLKAWVGALLAGLVVFVIFFVHGIGQAAGIPTLVLGVILLLLIAGWAVWSWRRGDREVATGVAVGYGLLTLISGGQCTLFVENGFEGGFNALTALVAYPLLLIVALITGGVASTVRRRRAGKENLQ